MQYIVVHALAYVAAKWPLRAGFGHCGLCGLSKSDCFASETGTPTTASPKSSFAIVGYISLVLSNWSADLLRKPIPTADGILAWRRSTPSDEATPATSPTDAAVSCAATAPCSAATLTKSSEGINAQKETSVAYLEDKCTEGKTTNSKPKRTWLLYSGHQVSNRVWPKSALQKDPQLCCCQHLQPGQAHQVPSYWPGERTGPSRLAVMFVMLEIFYEAHV